MKFTVLFFSSMVICWAATAQQILEFTILDSITREPIEGVSIIAKGSQKDNLYFSGKGGTVRVFSVGSQELYLNHIEYHPRLFTLKLLEAGKSGVVLLQKKDYVFNEVVIRSEKVNWHHILNELVSKQRKGTQANQSRLFLYELSSQQNSKLLEKSDGIASGIVDSEHGVNKIELITGRYLLLDTQPFFNLAFLQVLKYNRLFEKNSDSRLVSPLNFSKITPGNTKIESLPCNFCDTDQRLLQIIPTHLQKASARLLFNPKSLQIDQITISSNDNSLLRPISSTHVLSNLKFELQFNFYKSTLQYIRLAYKCDYMRDSDSIDDVQTTLVLKPFNGSNSWHLLHLGSHIFDDDYSALVTHPLNISLLEQQYHHLERVKLQEEYFKIAPQTALNDNLYVLKVLQKIAQYPLCVWDTTFSTVALQNLAETTQSHEDILLSNRYFFDFNWVFVRNESPDGSFYTSAPTFVNIHKSLFFALDNSHAQLFFNLIFDFTEWRRRLTLQKLLDGNFSVEAAERLIAEQFSETQRVIEKWAFDTKYGSRIEPLRSLNDLLFQQLGKDNFALYLAFQRGGGQFEDPQLNYADMLAIFNEFEKAAEQYTLLLSQEKIPLVLQLTMTHNRALCWAKLNRQKELCADIQFLISHQFSGIDPALLKRCQ